MATVKVIPARTMRQKILQVAAYYRVSSNSEDQRHSYAAQVLYYTKEIQRHPEWKLADIYADEGLTGTSMAKRKDFQRMLSDCRDGKIDRILVKSLSRFARNTKECLTVLREFSQLGVTVLFEKEHMDTATLTIEMMVSVFGAIAQQESVSISQNQRMSYQRRMEKGEFITCKPPYGYRIVNRRELEIVPEEAEVVRWIYKSYLKGYSYAKIKEALEAREIKSPMGGSQWSIATIRGMLRNEKYTGDALLQKTYITDCISKKVRKNNGERPMYYVENHHEAIVDRELFQRVQEEIARRSSRRKIAQKTAKTEKGKYSGKYALTERKAELSQKLDSLQRESEAASTLDSYAETVKAWIKSYPTALTEYDDLLTRNMVQRVTVVNEHLVRIRFYGVGEEMEQEMESCCK